MLRLEVELQSHRMIQKLSVDGHMDGPSGTNIGCAAASALLRTFTGLLEKGDGIFVSAEAPQPGSLILEVHHIDNEVEEWYQGACDFLIRGINDVSADFPGQVDVAYHTN